MFTGRVCAIAGGSGAGKTTLANKLLAELGGRGTHITIDWYYRDLTAMDPADRALVNYDHPDSLEVDLFVEDLGRLADGHAVEAPIYDFASHTRSSSTRRVAPAEVVVTEGIHLLGLAGVRALSDQLVFIDVPADIRFDRRAKRDVRERGRTLESVQAQWKEFVAPMHDEWVEPSKRFADRLVGADEDLDDVATELASHLTAHRDTTG